MGKSTKLWELREDVCCKNHTSFGVVKGQWLFERIPGNEMLGSCFLAKVLTSPREGIEGCSYSNLYLGSNPMKMLLPQSFCRIKILLYMYIPRPPGCMLKHRGFSAWIKRKVWLGCSLNTSPPFEQHVNNSNIIIECHCWKDSGNPSSTDTNHTYNLKLIIRKQPISLYIYIICMYSIYTYSLHRTTTCSVCPANQPNHKGFLLNGASFASTLSVTCPQEYGLIKGFLTIDFP